MGRDSWGRSAGSEWRRCEVSVLIKAAALEIGDGCRAKNNEFAPSGLPFARAGNIKDDFQFAEADRFPEENLERIGNKISEPGDVVFTSKGTVGRFACVREDIPQFVYSPQLFFWRSATSWFGYRDHLYRIHYRRCRPGLARKPRLEHRPRFRYRLVYAVRLK